MGKKILLNFEFFDSLKDAVYIVNSKRKILYWNRAAEELTGYKSSEVIGNYCYDNLLQHVDSEGNPLCNGNCLLKKICSDGKNREIELCLKDKRGQRKSVYVRGLPFKNCKEEIVGAIEIFSNDREKKSLEVEVERLKKLAYYDELTNVANRRSIFKLLEEKLKKYRETKSSFAIYYLDIDNFKKINDTYGHLVGDKVIYSVATTLKKILKSKGDIGRIGGEEFMIILDISTKEKLKEMGGLFRLTIKESKIYDETLKVTVSLGGPW